MVSDSTNVPETKATPSVTAATVRKSRSLLTSRFRSETLSISTAEPAHDLEHALPGRTSQLLDDRAVDEEHHPVGVRRGARVVGDHHHRLAEVVDDGTEELEELGAGLR